MKVGICALAALTAAGLLFATAAGSTPRGATAPQRAGTIAFIRFENKDDPGGPLLVIRPDGSGLRTVTPPRTTVREYAWSPDGRSIAYVDQRSSLWLLHRDGTGRRLLLPGSRLATASLSWSPDGKTIAIASGEHGGDCPDPGKIYLVPTSGARPKSLPARRVAPCYVAWSPRGNEIAYIGSNGTFVIHPDGTGRHRVPHVGLFAQWSADGRQLVFDHGSNWRNESIAVVDADGTHFHIVTTHAESGSTVWSPQGHRILYARANGKGIYMVDANVRINRRVTGDSPSGDAWSPDGASIVYGTGRTGNGDLYVVGVDGSDMVRLTNTPGDDEEPSWAR